ncbi:MULTISPECIES: hypothetical protein [Cobetia]|uniref:hypothetical protein n=1 Tax=Cobetia TaxID=204286 RepID=UPI00148274A2|nr:MULTISPECIES: hypothetical protein [Cobetia]
MIAILSLFLLFMNVLVAAPIANSSLSNNTINENKLKKNAVIGFMILVMFFIGTSSIEIIPKAVMKLYKFGDIKATKVVFDKDGCLILKEVGLKGVGGSDICYIKDVLILSRLGEEYYLEISSNAIMRNNAYDEEAYSTDNASDERVGSTVNEVKSSIDEPDNADLKSAHVIRVTMQAEHVLSWSTINDDKS